jgi:SAM-dependent methyltransferase
MRQDERTPYDRALRRARVAAYPPGEFVEQEGFMRAGEICSLARAAGIGPGVSVLDLCCGVAGPGRLITSELGCSYLGVDLSASAIELARSRATGLPCRFVVGEVPPVPNGPFDVVLLLETMLAFPDKDALLREVAAALVPGGRFACTVEAGQPLTEVEAETMPDADTVWPIPLVELVDGLSSAGLVVHQVRDSTRSHRMIADAVVRSLVAERSAIVNELGVRAVDDLLAAHRLWRDWMRAGRIRKFEVLAVRAGDRRVHG